MSKPIYTHFEFSGPPSECLNPAEDPQADPCKVKVTSARHDQTFTLARKGKKFSLVDNDKSRILGFFPKFKVPNRELANFLSVKKVFIEEFGTKDKPNPIMEKITVPGLASGSGQSPEEIRAATNEMLFSYLEKITNFISHGRLEAKGEPMQELLKNTLLSGIFIFADPTLGNLVIRRLNQLKGSPAISTAAKKRIDWLLALNKTRDKLWSAMGPEMGQSRPLETTLKRYSGTLLTFLFANYILEEKGYKDFIFSNQVRGTAKEYHEIKNRIDTNYDASKNFFSYMVGILEKMKQVRLPAEIQRDVNRRLGLLISDYKKEIPKETLKRLPDESPVNAIRVYLRQKYGDTPERLEALNIILSRVKIQVKSGEPGFLVPMTEIAPDLMTWTRTQPSKAEEKTALNAVLYLLLKLFEKGEQMEIFWDKKVTKVDNLYYSESIPLVGANKSSLEGLIVWSRGQLKSEGGTLRPETTPHVGLRKISLGLEFGVGGLGLGTMAALSALNNPQAKHTSQWASLTVGCAGAGAGLGNLLSYALDIDKNSYWFDIVGGVVGASACATVYGLAVPKPEEMIMTQPPEDPGKRNPVDPYGP